MLSYRHSYHAGNFADVLKHIVQLEILAYLVKKDKPFDYIDTHAGAGLYDLSSAHASKLGEYRHGIEKFYTAANRWPQLSRYLHAVRSVNRDGQLGFYPGSPLIAASFMRAKDSAWLYELHTGDYALLQKNTRGNSRIHVACSDGLQGMMAHLPPISRRALILIDPSYEIKTDYERVVGAIKQAHAKFSNGIYALWYPVINRHKINRLEAALQRSGIRDIQRYELAIAPDSVEPGMTASGMIVINPPWGLSTTMAELLPALAGELDGGAGGNYKNDVLVPE